ncbi:bifunctional biotin--[acetyl-CoA-carboxylase] ligase/biotin operon repressor BirA [Pseudidiomarina terrestris]|uniref:Bifunctional ligase/repressor BirA n=1 Tax=Pseudidiomarina terrestris TaxID=2820060 RepID=A0ABT8MK01_9GAMM|nr:MULTISPECIES: bifunctional biotin--[acetyl-CoA-carboxylase] ligase/biotin operon repressor BirA [unclassified Pseudidiomarina]MDN7127528.1 bifunctional biotin--[acetyl-CoA-carboxylase] ligase/biotin operon repressor BirA [Pseudidiomarina sp. 1APR75-33.1]MDN7130274.1 bifunctional biotin--[acetyl-CoA-carboxylase] ligase/biotin operon repressor BirA [Pseudidiomarina sp. 1APR75-15]MDN7136197.1 bifunctional biotin--[acetyl-CoA-carboxylase] ligase/biotin operon repressor BirA [Pseudidiomarina sp. 1
MSKRNERVIKVIELLADGEFHSGQTIGDEIGVTRTAISQYIKDIQGLGVDVFRVTGKGYRLAKAVELLDEDIITRELKAPVANIEVERVVTSSNDVLRERLRENKELNAGYAVLAEAQTAGRGRRGKAWYSPFASNLYLSMYWPLEHGMSGAMGLSVAIGTALAETLAEDGMEGVQLKWPNDILVGGKKIAGILIELEGQATDSAHAIIGIGINLRMPDWLDAPIDQPWTDVETELNGRVERNQLVAKLLNKLRTALQAYDVEGLAPFIERWSSFDKLQERAVRIQFGEKYISGVAKGISEDGALLVEVAGEVKRFHAGEVSLRYES